MSTTTPVEERPAAVPAPDPAPADEPGTGLTFEAIAVIALIVAFAAVITSVFAIGIAARSIDEHRAIADGGGSGGGPVAVSLEEFAINPAPLSASAGATISVTNDGTTTHDLTVEGQDLATPTLDAGGTADLDVSTLAPGTYTVFCSIPGHRESGMETDLTVG
jgi:plastocyanin